MQAIALLHSQLQQITTRVEENRRLVSEQEETNGELLREINDEMEIAQMAKRDIDKFSEDLNREENELQELLWRNQTSEAELSYLQMQVASHLTAINSMVAGATNRAADLSQSILNQYKFLRSERTKYSLETLRSLVEESRLAWKRIYDLQPTHDEFNLIHRELSLERSIQSLESESKALKERYNHLHRSQKRKDASIGYQEKRSGNHRPDNDQSKASTLPSNSGDVSATQVTE